MSSNFGKIRAENVYEYESNNVKTNCCSMLRNQRRKKWERKRNNHKKFFKINHCKFYLLIRFFTSNLNFVFHFTHKLWIENMGEEFLRILCGRKLDDTEFEQNILLLFMICYILSHSICEFILFTIYYFFHFSLQLIIEAKNKKQNSKDMK